MNDLSVVVAGVPALAHALKETGVFRQVLSAKSTGELRQVVTGPELKGVNKEGVAFIFGDTLEESGNLTLAMMVNKLSSTGWKVLIVAMTPKAIELANNNPQAGGVKLPLTINKVLGSLAGFGFNLSPYPNGYAELDLAGEGGAAVKAQPKAPALDSAPVLGGWSKPPAETPSIPIQPVPSANGGFKAPEAVKEPSPAWGNAQPVENNTPWGAPPQKSGWQQPPAEQPQEWQPSRESTSVGWGGTKDVDQSWGAPTGEPVIPAWPSEPNNAGRPSLSGLPAPATVGGWGGYGMDAPPVQRESNTGFGGAQIPNSDSWSQGGPVARPGYQAQYALPSRRGMVITIAVSKGGTGKSSLTLNLAVFLALRLRGEGKTVCIIDTNFQQADTGKYLAVYHPNIMNVANDPTLLTREKIGQALIHKQEYNISALLGPATPDDGNPQWITARLYNQILDLLKEQYDYIFIDTPVAEKFHTVFSEFALPRADFIVVPVAPNNATLHNADTWLRQAVTAPRHANGAGVPREKIGIVLNRAKDNIGCSEEDVRANLANWNFLGAIPETDEWQKANNTYQVVATYNYAELDEAFANVLYQATGEEVLLASFRQHEESRGGISTALKKMFRMGR